MSNSVSTRGYFGIGIYHVKNEINIGTLWRSAFIYGASFIFTIGRRYKKQSSDTLGVYRHIPLFHFLTLAEFLEHMPYDCQLVCIENSNEAQPLTGFIHPERAMYLLGAEDHGLPPDILDRYQTIIIESIREFSLNVAVAGTIVMYERFRRCLENVEPEMEEGE